MLHQPIEGAFFRMAFRHFLQTRGYSRDQAKRLINDIGWDAFKARIRIHGPNLLTTFQSYDFQERPAFVIETVPDDSEFDIVIPDYENLIREKPDADAQVSEPNGS